MSEHGFGKYLRDLREERHISINQLAFYSGVSAPQISRIETGTRGVPKPDTIRKLANALKASYDDMMVAAGYVEQPHAASHVEGNEELRGLNKTRDHSTPSWATSKDQRDIKKILEEDLPVMFDGKPVSDEDRQRITDLLTGFLWESKEMNKKTYGRKKSSRNYSSEDNEK
ncbi:helix-turn-helix transcriptional regulator [Paenibacillus filicis]|uniref:Helix-turn-helix transcriptional regulator n=1 Tax=Paenibacillus gyeongsangnamensis TaxID=3388067 RepID=A0ABT4Q9G8_9BACL|nr:helix-turn-helix transcriptional regulator [Paenibacillus filicis]MCZ8513466.1 helix-turn-helix transcriptional regulator [Paenibacillus filicis]